MVIYTDVGIYKKNSCMCKHAAVCGPFGHVPSVSHIEGYVYICWSFANVSRRHLGCVAANSFGIFDEASYNSVDVST